MPAEARDPSHDVGPIVRLTGGHAASSAKPDVRPHVLLVLDGFPKTLGGGERIVLRLAALLPHYGYRVSILTLALHPEGEFQVGDSPCPLYLLPLRKTYDLTAWKGAFALRALIRRENIAIVQTFFESSDLWAGFLTRVLSSAKLVWSRRDMGILRGAKHTAAYRAMRHLPHAVLAVSEQVRQHAITVDGISPARVHTVYNGLDLHAVTRLPGMRETGPIVVTTVGNIRRVKGHDLFIRAAAEVLRFFPDVQFSIAGEVLEPDYFQELQGLVESFGLSSHFRFLGRITDLPAHLRHADIFVLPSRSEGFSNALLEAMASGLPVIATNVGGNSEAVKTNASGIIIAREDPLAIASALQQVLASPALARQFGEAARQRVQQLFSTDAMMRKTLEIYVAIQRSR